MSSPLIVPNEKNFTINCQKTITNMSGVLFAITEIKKKINKLF